MEVSEAGCLNPFEFRAGICFEGDAQMNREVGLNPFEFRAGICLSKECHYSDSGMS